VCWFEQARDTWRKKGTALNNLVQPDPSVGVGKAEQVVKRRQSLTSEIGKEKFKGNASAEIQTARRLVGGKAHKKKRTKHKRPKQKGKSCVEIQTEPNT